MYIVTIVSWIASVFGQFQAVSFVRALQLCESFSGWDDSIQNTIGTGALTINVCQSRCFPNHSHSFETSLGFHRGRHRLVEGVGIVE